MRSAAIVVVIVGTLLTGCTSEPVAIEVTHLAGWGTYPAEPFIQVLQARPADPYVPVARLAVNGAVGLDRTQALAALEQRARELGANAIIVTEENRLTTPDLTFNPSGGTYSLAVPQPAVGMVGEAIHVNTGDASK